MFGFKLLYYDRLSSTNDYARDHLLSLEHGTVVRAGFQTAGRGQRSNKWLSPSGENLYFSVILKPAAIILSQRFIEDITFFSAEAIKDLLEKEFFLDAVVKRPNDVYVKGKKIAGVLIEAVTQGEIVSGLVIGIGMNVNVASLPEEIKDIATSVEIEYGKKINIEVCFNKLIEMCQLYYHRTGINNE